MNLTLVRLLLGATLAVPGIARAVTEGDFEVNPRGGAIGAIGGNAALGMTVGRVVGMSAGYIYSKNKQGSE